MDWDAIKRPPVEATSGNFLLLVEHFLYCSSILFILFIHVFYLGFPLFTLMAGCYRK
jgi:hypothetical protein